MTTLTKIELFNLRARRNLTQEEMVALDNKLFTLAHISPNDKKMLAISKLKEMNMLLGMNPQLMKDAITLVTDTRISDKLVVLTESDELGIASHLSLSLTINPRGFQGELIGSSFWDSPFRNISLELSNAGFLEALNDKKVSIQKLQRMVSNQPADFLHTFYDYFDYLVVKIGNNDNWKTSSEFNMDFFTNKRTLLLENDMYDINVPASLLNSNSLSNTQILLAKYLTQITNKFGCQTDSSDFIGKVIFSSINFFDRIKFVTPLEENNLDYAIRITQREVELDYQNSFLDRLTEHLSNTYDIPFYRVEKLLNSMSDEAKICVIMKHCNKILFDVGYVPQTSDWYQRFN